MSGNNEQGVTIEAVPADDKKQTKGKPAKSKERNQDSFKLGVWFKEIKAEFGKIVWPNRKELAKMTFTVIVTSLIFGVLIAGFDAVFGFAIGFLVDLF